MKKGSIVLFILAGFSLVSCWHHRGNTQIKLSESDNYYSMDAWFNENRTREVEEYMNDKIGRRSNVSFVNTRIDGRISLDDHTTFSIKKFPGHVEIELNKNKNSESSYRQIKSLCEGLQEVLQ